jgi:BON domain-containing protein
MNLTSIITLPARLGYEVARKTLDIAVGAGRLVGLFREEGAESPVEKKPAAQPQRSQRAAPERARPARPKPARAARTGTARAKPARRGSVSRSGGTARKPAGAAAARATASKPAAAQPAEPEADRQPASLGSRVPGAVEAEEVTLIRRVETEVLRDIDAPEIALDVNPIGGVVRLSGRASGADQVRELQRRALAVPGVKRVDNDLSIPDTPAPGPFNAERHTADAEPLPTDLADRGEGRQPAPLGGSDDAPGGGGGDARTTVP